MHKTPWIRSLVFISSGLLLPFLLLTIFAWPSTDDYSMSFLMTQRGENAFEVVRHLYQTWVGRYSTLAGALLSAAVVEHIWFYRLLLAITMVTLFLSVRFFIKQLLIVNGKKNNNDIITLISMIVMIIWIQTIPGIADSFYWYSGMVVYTWPLIFFFLGSGGMLQRKSNAGIKILTGFCIFAMVGFNEMAAGIGVVLLLIIIVEGMRGKNLKRYLWISPFVITGVLILLISPGNQDRLSLFPAGQNILTAIEISFISLMKLNGIILTNITLWMIAWGIFPWLKVTNFHISVRRYLSWHPAVVFFTGQLVLLGLLFIPSWSMGINPPLRVYNFLVPFALLWVIWMVVSFRERLPDKDLMTFPVLKGKGIKVYLFIVVLSLMFSFVKIPGGEIVFGGNIPRAYYDLFFRAAAYNEQMQQREQIIKEKKAAGIKDIVLPSLTSPPSTIHFLDMTADANHWINALYAGHYEVEKIRTEE